MVVKDLIKELERYNPESPVFIRDGHHLMRKYALERLDDEPSQEYSIPGNVILVGMEPPRHG